MCFIKGQTAWFCSERLQCVADTIDQKKSSNRNLKKNPAYGYE